MGYIALIADFGLSITNKYSKTNLLVQNRIRNYLRLLSMLKYNTSFINTYPSFKNFIDQNTNYKYSEDSSIILSSNATNMFISERDIEEQKQDEFPYEITESPYGEI